MNTGALPEVSPGVQERRKDHGIREHAERNLALLRQLEAETQQLLESLDRLDPEQSAWLQEVARPIDLYYQHRADP